MSITITKDRSSAVRISRTLHMLSGYITMDNSYAASGELLTDITDEFKDVQRIVFGETFLVSLKFGRLIPTLEVV